MNDPANEADLRSACARVRRRIQPLVDGGLSLVEAARDEGHLEACRDCHADLESHRRLLERLRAASRPPSSEVIELERRVLERVSARLPRRTPETLRWARLGWAAAVLFACAWSLTREAGMRPAADEIAGLHPVLEHLPDWSATQAGLAELSRRLAEGMR